MCLEGNLFGSITTKKNFLLKETQIRLTEGKTTLTLELEVLPPRGGDTKRRPKRTRLITRGEQEEAQCVS